MCEIKTLMCEMNWPVRAYRVLPEVRGEGRGGSGLKGKNLFIKSIPCGIWLPICSA